MLAPPNVEPVFGAKADGENLIDTRTEVDTNNSFKTKQVIELEKSLVYISIVGFVVKSRSNNVINI